MLLNEEISAIVFTKQMTAPATLWRVYVISMYLDYVSLIQ